MSAKTRRLSSSPMNRRTFLKQSALATAAGSLGGAALSPHPSNAVTSEPALPSSGAAGQLAHGAGSDWIRTARVFLMDAYQPPFAPKLEYDAQALARTLVEMHVNTVRFATMGKYATIQGVRFSAHPDLGSRDLLAETIANIPLRRAGTPEDVAHAVAFLAAESNGFITGATLDINGGVYGC